MCIIIIIMIHNNNNNALARAAAATVTFILKRPVTDAAERMLKLLTRTNIGGLKAAPPPPWQSPYSHTAYTPTRYAYYILYTGGTRYGVIPLTHHISTNFQ